MFYFAGGVRTLEKVLHIPPLIKAPSTIDIAIFIKYRTAVWHDPAVSYDLLRGFYLGLETVYQTQGFLEEGYALCGVTIVAPPPVQVSFEEQAASQWENFVQD